MRIMVLYFLDAIFFSQAADELHEQEVRQKNDEIQQKSAQLELTQVLNPVLMQVGCVPLQQNHNNLCMTIEDDYLVIDISADSPKMQNFLPGYIRYIQY